MVDPGTAYLLAQGGKTGLDLIGSLLGMGGKKKAQGLFDMSLAELEALQGKSVLDVGKIRTTNRAAMLPRAKELGDQMSRRFNMDQPRAQKYFTDQLFDEEAKQLPGLMERNQRATSLRDLDIRKALMRARASQLG